MLLQNKQVCTIDRAETVTFNKTAFTICILWPQTIKIIRLSIGYLEIMKPVQFSETTVKFFVSVDKICLNWGNLNDYDLGG